LHGLGFANIIGKYKKTFIKSNGFLNICGAVITPTTG
jgi:hypothetical protein